MYIDATSPQLPMSSSRKGVEDFPWLRNYGKSSVVQTVRSFESRLKGTILDGDCSIRIKIVKFYL